jgi:hypothetical protein
MFDSLPKTNCNGENLRYAVGLMRITVVACKTTCSQTEIRSFVLMSNGLAIIGDV